MTTTHKIRMEPMTEESFAPFGALWDAGDRPADQRVIKETGYTYAGRTTASIIWQPHGGLGFTVLERHFGVTQSFVQMSGAPAVVCVAAPTATEAPADVPDPADVHALLIDPTKAYSFARGTWHSLNRHVLAPPGATFLILNSDPNPTQMVDYETGELTVYADLGSDAVTERSALGEAPGVTFEITM
jgi:ureidoglycolate hydrolase